MKVILFSPCFVDQFFPYTIANCRKILERYGCEVEWAEATFCCGQAALNSGFAKEAASVYSHMVKKTSEDSYFVIPSSSCGGFIKNYSSVLKISDSIKEKSEAIKKNTYEFSEFLIDVLKIDGLTSSYKGKVAYHSSCASIRELNIADKVEAFLKEKTNLNLVPFSHSETCCGFGGTFAVKFSDISVSMGQFKVEHFKEKNIDAIISNDMSCLLHIGSLLKKQGSDITVRHLADVLV